MKKDWLDKRLEEKLEGFEMPFDLEAAWSDLESVREQKKKRRPIFWWLGGMGLGIALAFLFYQVNSNQKSEASALSLQTDKSDHTAALPILSKDLLQRCDKAQDQNLKNEQTTLKTNKSHLAKSELGLGEPRPIAASTATRSVQQEYRKSTKKFAPKILEKDASLHGELISPAYKIVKVDKVQNNMARSSIADKALALNSNAAPLLEIFAPIQGLQIPAIIHHKSKKAIGQILINEEQRSKSRDKSNALELNLSYGKSFLNFTNNNLPPARFDVKKAEEKAVDMMSLNLNYRKYFGENFFISSGINLQSWSDRIQYEREVLSQEMVNNLPKEVTIYADGTRDTLFGDVMVDVIESAQIDVWNSYTYLGIPLQLGYERMMQDAFGVRVALGLNFNTLIKAEADIFLNDDRLTSLPKEHLQKSIFQGLGSISFLYRLTNAWELNAGLNTVIDLSERTKENEAYQSKYNSWNLHIGISTRF